jgi:hypothetical protein
VVVVLEAFTVETFADRLGEPFRVTTEDGSTLELGLASATAAPARPNEEPRSRAPFSIVFHGPPEPVLPQRIYQFEHEALGAFELFIVPLGPEGSAMQYEAVFG